MKVQIDLKIIFLCIVYLILNQLELYLLFIVFITIHEIMHALVGIICGFKPASMEIMPFGLSLTFYSFSSANAKKKIITYLAGPISNIILAIIFIGVSNKYNTNDEIIVYSIYTNILLGIFNLLPILPLDGGKILKEILKKIYGNKKSYSLISFIGKVTLAILKLFYSIFILKFKNIGVVVILMYLWYLKIKEDKKINRLIKLYDCIEKNFD